MGHGAQGYSPGASFSLPGGVRRAYPHRAVAFLRTALGVLSLALGLILLGECAAHTARALFAQGVREDMAYYLLRAAFFAPMQHAPPYPVLLGAGAALGLVGCGLLRQWALPFLVFSSLCFAVFGGMVVGRHVAPRGDEASLVGDGVRGIPAQFSGADLSDAAMVLGLGVFGLLTGLWMVRMQAQAAPAARRAGARRAAHSMSATSEPAPGPSGGGVSHAEAGMDTSVDLDLSPDLDTAEVGVPTPVDLSGPADLPGSAPGTPGEGSSDAPGQPEAPVPDAPPAERPPEETRVEPPPLSAPSIALPLASLALGLGAAAAPATLLLARDALGGALAGQVWAGGMGLGLGALGLAVLARPSSALKWGALCLSLAGLGGGAALVAAGR